MSLHDEIVARIGQRADQLGVLWTYNPSSVQVQGHRGVPDMLLAGPGGIALAEIKTGGGLEDGQERWRDILLAGRVAWHLWMFGSLYDGSVDQELHRLATPPRL